MERSVSADTEIWADCKTCMFFGPQMILVSANSEAPQRLQYPVHFQCPKQGGKLRSCIDFSLIMNDWETIWLNEKSHLKPVLEFGTEFTGKYIINFRWVHFFVLKL